MNKKHSNCYKFLSRNGLIVSVLVGVAVGFAFGFGLRDLEPSADAITWIGRFCKICNIGMKKMLYLNI